MAEIVLGIGSSHGPQLEMPPENWRAYGESDQSRAPHWFGGKTYAFEELMDVRAEEHLERECTDEKFATRFRACLQSIAHLSETIERVAPDVCVVVGDDQHEAFNDDNMPPFAIYHGATVNDVPRSSAHRAKWGDATIANRPRAPLTHATDASLGHHLIETMTEHEFDVARSNELPLGRGDRAIGHAFYYVYRRLMDNKPLPSVPVMVNTYFPPNTPTARRCYNFGRVLRQAIETWDADKRVAIIASGGLSHRVIEEEFDARILDGLRRDDEAMLTDYPDERFRDGTSEIKNWIAVGAAMAGTGLQMNLVDYVPCYRTPGGNGCAMGFVEWV